MDYRIVYYDFGKILTKRALKVKLTKRIKELSKQGFDKKQIQLIVFESSDFKNNFIDRQLFEELRTDFINSP